MPRPFSRLAMVLLAIAAPHAAARGAELRVVPPPGHVVEPAKPTGSYSEAYAVSSTLDSNAGCEIALQPADAPGVSQAQLNAISAKPDYVNVVKSFIGLVFDVTSTEPFQQGDVRGVLANATPKADHSVGMLFVTLTTPRGRTNISCVGPAARFAALRPEFLSIVRGVQLPR